MLRYSLFKVFVYKVTIKVNEITNQTLLLVKPNLVQPEVVEAIEVMEEEEVLVVRVEMVVGEEIF